MAYSTEENALLIYDEIVRLICNIEWADRQTLDIVRSRLHGAGLDHQVYLQIKDLIDLVEAQVE